MQWGSICNCRGKNLTCNHTHMYWIWVSHTHVYTHILFNGPNPLCESVSLVVTNTIGLFTYVCVHGVYISKTETDCGSVIGFFMGVCYQEQECVCERVVREEGVALRKHFNSKPVFSPKQFVLHSYTVSVCLCIWVRADCDWLSLRDS